MNVIFFLTNGRVRAERTCLMTSHRLSEISVLRGEDQTDHGGLETGRKKVPAAQGCTLGLQQVGGGGSGTGLGSLQPHNMAASYLGKQQF